MAQFMTRKEFIDFFRPIWALRLDLEDDVTSELEEVKDEVKAMTSEDNYIALAEWVNDILSGAGYPTMPLSDEGEEPEYE